MRGGDGSGLPEPSRQTSPRHRDASSGDHGQAPPVGLYPSGRPVLITNGATGGGSMTAASRQVLRAGGDTLILWAERSGCCRAREPGRSGLRFAFYGSVSTEDDQDPVTSRARQRDQTAARVA